MRHLLVSLLLPLVATGPAPQGRVELDPAVPATGHAYLTIVNTGKAVEDGLRVRRQRLVLVSPSGDESTLLRRKVKHSYDVMRIADWSPDGRTALLQTGRPHGKSEATSLDLTTGETRTLHLSDDVDDVILDPDGSGVLTTVFDEEGTTPFLLQHTAWDGVVTTLPERTAGSMLPGPDHTLMTLGEEGGSKQLRILSLDTGAVVRTFKTGAHCSPVRWWDDTSVLATCGRNLSLIDWATGAVSPLSTQHTRGDYGHIDAREIDSGLYVQVAGACGTTFIAHQDRKGAVRPVDVPGAIGNVVTVDGEGRWLVIEHTSDCGGNDPRAVLSRFDPTTRQERPLVVLGRHQRFGDIRALGEVTAVS